MVNFKKVVKTAFFSVLLGSSISFSAYAADYMAGTVNVQTSLNLRTEPSVSASSIGHLKSGDKILIEQSDHSGWYKAYTAAGFGYVSSEYVVSATSADADFGSGIITGSVVNFRKAAGTQYEIIGKLCANDTVKIVGVNGEWLKISRDSSVGYVHSDYIKPCDSASAAQASAASVKASSLIAYAKGYLGVPYVRGGSSAKGFDCSGFTQFVFKKFGVSLSRTASAQVKNCASVARASLKSGDLVFFRSPSSSKVGHVGIYIGSGQFIHSSSPGDVVKIDSITSGYYDKYYVCAGRVSF